MRTTIILILAVALYSCPVFSQDRILMAVTTSTENSGLLEAILPHFERTYNITVDVLAVGTGKAVTLGENGDVDVILIHHRASEDAFVENGFGVNRRDVMYNDFVIVGPVTDPAGIRGLNGIESLQKIAQTGSVFVSRGDKSGTHLKENELWKLAGTDPAASGDRYLEAGQGMGPTLLLADEKNAYSIADRGTFLSLSGKIDLIILSGKDTRLYNPYGIIAVNPEKHPHVKFSQSMALINWFVSPGAQKLIGEFKKNDHVLFFPNAGK
jgi:tungstate transport system substrate-binding protein